MRRIIVVLGLALGACGLSITGAELTAESDDAGALEAGVEASHPGPVGFDASLEGGPQDAGDGGVEDASCVPDASSVVAAGTMRAPSAAVAPVIDGDLGDWACVPFFHLTSSNGFVEKATSITGDIAVQWTPSHLYFALRVQNGVAPKGNDTTDPFQNDSIEIYLAKDDAPTGAYRTGDHHYVVDYKNRVADYTPGKSSPPPAQFTSAAKVSGTDYSVEVAVASDAVGHAFAASKMAFDVELNQSDGTKQVGILVFFEPTGASTTGSTCGSVPEPSCNTHLFAQLQLLP